MSARYGCAAAFNTSSKDKAVYVFGGQQHWSNSNEAEWVDPNLNFSNKVFRLHLEEGTWKELHILKANKTVSGGPSPRSQSFVFIRKDQLFVYGGYDGSNIFCDLHKLELSTLEWTEVETAGEVKPTGLRGNVVVLVHLEFSKNSLE